jgi:hypothetical protein
LDRLLRFRLVAFLTFRHAPSERRADVSLSQFATAITMSRAGPFDRTRADLIVRLQVRDEQGGVVVQKRVASNRFGANMPKP